MKFLMEGHVDSIYTPHPTASFSQCTILRHKQKKAHPISLLHSSMPPQKKQTTPWYTTSLSTKQNKQNKPTHLRINQRVYIKPPTNTATGQTTPATPPSPPPSNAAVAAAELDPSVPFSSVPLITTVRVLLTAVIFAVPSSSC